MTPVQDPATGLWFDADTGMGIDGPASSPSDLPAPAAPQPAPGPVSTPGQVPVQAPPPGPAATPGQVEPQSQSQSSSSRGYDPATGAILDAESARAKLQGPPAGQPVQDANWEAQLQADSAGQLEDSQRQIAEIEARKMAAQEDAYRARAELEGDLISSERLAHEHAEAAADGQLAQYQQGLQALKQLQLDPTLNFSAGEELGNAASLFAQGFLAAGGTKIDAAGTLDRWTDRYVGAQMERYKRQQQLTEGERVVWDMIRTQSADEADARLRLKGMLLDQAGTQMQAEAAKYGSQMATALGEEATAKIRGALANTLMEIRRNAREVTYKNLQADRQHWLGMRQLSIQSSAQAETVRHNQAIEAAAAPTTGPAFQVFSLDKDGQVVGELRPEYREDKATAAKIAWRQGNTERIVKAADTLKMYQENYGPIPTEVSALRALLGDDAKVVMAARADLFTALREDAHTGAALTGTEEDLINDRAGLNTWINQLTSTGSKRVLDSVRSAAIRNADSELRPFLQDPGEPGKKWTGSLATQTKGQADAGVLNETPPLTDAQTMVKRIASDQPDEVRPTGKASGEDLLKLGRVNAPFRDNNDSLARDTSLATAQKNRSASTPEWTGFVKGEPTVNPAGETWTADTIALARAARQNPDSEAFKGLRDLATGDVPSGPKRQAFARYLLADILNPSDNLGPAVRSSPTDLIREGE